MIQAKDNIIAVFKEELQLKDKLIYDLYEKQD